jgi:hypothetical protein
MNTFNQNNQYGNNVMNFGPQPRMLDHNVESQIKSMIPNGSTVSVVAVLGNGEAFNFASQIKNFLEKNGYSVSGVDQAVYSGNVAPQSINRLDGDNGKYEVVIGNQS